nr:MAG: YggT family protein [Sphaerobacter thermophilus]
MSVALIFNILMTFLTVMQFAIIARALLSWFDRGMRSPVAQILVQITEPIMAPIRRVLPTAGFIDFSPIVAILLIWVLRQMLVVAVAG